MYKPKKHEWVAFVDITNTLQTGKYIREEMGCLTIETCLGRFPHQHKDVLGPNLPGGAECEVSDGDDMWETQPFGGYVYDDGKWRIHTYGGFFDNIRRIQPKEEPEHRRLTPTNLTEVSKRIDELEGRFSSIELNVRKDSKGIDVSDLYEDPKELTTEEKVAILWGERKEK